MKKPMMILGAVTAALLLSAGCSPQKQAEAAINAALSANGENAHVNMDGQNMTVTTKDGTATFSSSGSLPADFPTDLGLPGGYAVVGTMVTAQGQVANLEYGKPLADLQKEIKGNLVGQGWKIEMEMTMGEGASLQVSKGERNAFVVLSSSSGKTTVSITIEK